MRFQTSVAAALTVAGTAVAANDPGARLTKPPLRSNLDYVIDGLMNNLPPTQYTQSAWTNDLIPDGCKSIVTGQGFSPNDVTVHDVTYSDCGHQWVFCIHNSAQIGIDKMAEAFGRLPIQMREYVRHVSTLPADGGWAFEVSGDITFLGDVPNLLSVVIHETGHSLDLNGAYADKPLSSSDKWWSEYDQDSNVPDNYAQTNAIEDVAQNTVIATYDVNVQPNGFGTIEPDYINEFHQFATVITEAREAGNGNSILIPGKGSTCNQRIPATNPVSKSSSFRRGDSTSGPMAPSVRLPSWLKEIDTSKRTRQHSGCSIGRDS